MVGGLLGLNLSSSVYAQSTEIKATLCDTNGPDIDVTQPASDSVVNNPKITVSGNVTRTSQLDIYINNIYSQSVAISQSNPDFSIDIFLDKGTNTIRLEAFYSCNNTSNNSEVVVTYEPGSKPSEGKDTNTKTTEPGQTRPLTVNNPATDDAKTPGEVIFTWPERFRQYFSFDNPDYVVPVFSWIVLLLLTILTILVLLPLQLLSSFCEELRYRGSVVLIKRIIISIILLIVTGIIFVTIFV